TAEAIVKHHPDTPFTEDFRLRERDKGKLSGKSIQDALNLVKEEGTTYGDYGEPEQDFKARVVDFFNDIITKHLPKNDDPGSSPSNKRNSHILLVTHGGVIRKLIKEYLIADLDFSVNNLNMNHSAKNTSVTKFVVRRAESLNSTVNDDDATNIEQMIKIKGEITLWSCVSHLATQGKRALSDSHIK
ncbi:24453_t:CDS:2, partial [Racocetra persica]